MWLNHLLTWGYEPASGAFCRARYTLRSSFEAVNLQTAGRALKLLWWHACRQPPPVDWREPHCGRLQHWLQTLCFSIMLLRRLVSYMVHLISASTSSKANDMQHNSGFATGIC